MNIICDLDGTIALDTGRAHFLHKMDCPKQMTPGDHSLGCICSPQDRNWEAYFNKCDRDTPNEAVIELLRRFITGNLIYILSGRSQIVGKKTIEWIEKHKVPYSYLQMREEHDRTADDILKLRWADQFNLTPENTLFVLEDRERVVNAWRKKGFRCFQVAEGNF